jgi:hypothetical protein
MNASSAVGAAVVLFSLAVSPAIAIAPVSKALTQVPGESLLIVNADFVQGHEAVAGIPARQAAARAELSKAMSQRYFDLDIIVTLGALALASGAFVAAGIAGSRRRAAAQQIPAPREGWREEVMQALEADLAQFTVSLPRAA